MATRQNTALDPLADKLRWPANTRTADDLAKWRAQWFSAFSLRYGQVINDSKTLALAAMAELAKRIRRRVNTVLTLESDSGPMRQMPAQPLSALLRPGCGRPRRLDSIQPTLSRLEYFSRQRVFSSAPHHH